MCFSCHQWFGGNPADSGYWITEKKGEKYMELLREKRDLKVKITKAEEKEIAAWYRKEHKMLEECRAAGQTGKLDFTSYQ